LKYQVGRRLQVLRLPVVLPLVDAFEHRVQPEVDRPHVTRTHLGFEGGHDCDPFFGRAVGRTASRRLDHDVYLLADLRGDLVEQVGIVDGSAGLGVPDMDVDDRSAGFGRGDTLCRDLLGRRREVG
jgi:hypothetical protein